MKQYKIREAFDEIKMNDSLKESIINECNRQQEERPKRNFSKGNLPKWMPVLSAVSCVIIIFFAMLLFLKTGQENCASPSPCTANTSTASVHTPGKSMVPTASPDNSHPTQTPKPTAPEHFILNDLGYQLPDKLTPYRPETEILPLVSDEISYDSADMSGTINFIGKDKNLLSFSVKIVDYSISYQTIYIDASYVKIPTCFLLKDENNKWAVMRLDGSLATDFIYDMYSSSILSCEGYVRVEKKITDNRYAQGIVDIRTGELVFPFQENELTLLNGIAVAQENEENNFIFYDYNGNLLFQIDRIQLNVINDYSSFRGKSGYEDLPEYTIDLDRRKILEISNYKGTINKIGNLYHVYNLDAVPATHTFLDENLNLIKSLYNYREAYEGNDFKMFFSSNNGPVCFVITSGGQFFEARFPDSIPIDIEQFYIEQSGQQWNIYFNITELDKIVCCSYDPDGNLISMEEQTAPPKYYIENSWLYTGKSGYVNEEGKEVISVSGKSRIVKLGEFILVIHPDKLDTTYLLYNKKGDVLAENLYGVIFELYWEDGILVYKSADVCGILKSDGTFEQLSGLPEASRICKE